MTFPDDTIVITFAIICNEWLSTLTYLCKLIVLLAGFVTQNLKHFPPDLLHRLNIKFNPKTMGYFWIFHCGVSMFRVFRWGKKVTSLIRFPSLAHPVSSQQSVDVVVGSRDTVSTYCQGSPALYVCAAHFRHQRTPLQCSGRPVQRPAAGTRAWRNASVHPREL